MNKKRRKRILDIKRELKKSILLHSQRDLHSQNKKKSKKVESLMHGDKPEIKVNSDTIQFTIRPGSILCGKIQIAYYLFKDDEKIDMKWYSEDYNYVVDTKKYGSGTYRIQYFIVDKEHIDPGNAEKLNIAYSDNIDIK